MRTLIVLVSALALAFAQAPQFAVDGQVVYSASFPLGRWEGGNGSVKGAVRWDVASGEASGEVCLDMGQFNSGIGLRDDDARGVLEVGRFPQACLAPTRLAWAENRRDAVLEGTLTFRGLKKALRIPGQLAQHGSVYRFTGSFKTSFSEWGMERPQRLFLLVDDPIEVRLEARAVPR